MKFTSFSGISIKDSIVEYGATDSGKIASVSKNDQIVFLTTGRLPTPLSTTKLYYTLPCEDSGVTE